MKSKTYEEFVDKFKPKLTTDDCYTPLVVYDVIKDWACNRYDISEKDIVRPFWPGADYTKAEYPEECVVLDNPPFSILSKICRFYLDRNIKFFLFAPSLTVLSGKDVCMEMNHIVCGAEVVYENGAVVRTAFVTNLGKDGNVMEACPDLGQKINRAVDIYRRETVRDLPKYDYPNCVVTAAMLQKFCRYGVSFQVKKAECARISALDSQKQTGKAVFGSGLLLSTAAAKRKQSAEMQMAANAAAEKLAEKTQDAICWPLSDRERAIIAELDTQSGKLE